MSNVQVSNEAIVPNAKRLLLAGFMAILAAGVGFGIRGGILANWGADFGFTGQQLGDINGAGFTGFCFGIIIGGIICDRIGYGKLVIAAFSLHVLSALITFAAAPGQAQMTAYRFLYWGTFIFAVANGTLEAVANPLVATLFPNNRTHYLNILHASWPAGLIGGGVIGWVLGEGAKWPWKAQLGLFLVPTAFYGILFLGQHMPKSEASQKGLSLGEMFKDVGVMGGAIICFLLGLFFSNALGLSQAAAYSLAGGLMLVLIMLTHTHGDRGQSLIPFGAMLLFALFITHGLIGSVELGTDGWIQNITGNILTPAEGKILFVFTSALMFSLRFCADFIEKKIGLSPIGILLTCSIIACVGLNLVSGIATFAGALVALAVYAVGKTFFWPTMLAVASDRFPRTGAVAISIMGGIGMMSAGLIGSTGLGYAKDRFAGAELQNTNPSAFEAYKASNPSKFLFLSEVHGLDGKKLGEVQQNLANARDAIAKSGVKDSTAAIAKLTPAERAVQASSIKGDRKTLVADSFIPATMAVIYLIMLLYFKAIGGYKPVHIVPVAEQQAAERKAAS